MMARVPGIHIYSYIHGIQLYIYTEYYTVGLTNLLV